MSEFQLDVPLKKKCPFHVNSNAKSVGAQEPSYEKPVKGLLVSITITLRWKSGDDQWNAFTPIYLLLP